MKRLAVVWVLVACPGTVQALADVEGTIQITGGNFIPPGTVARAVVTIKNNGPGIETNALAGTFYSATVGFRTVGVVRIAETAPCLVQYTDFIAPPPQPSTIAVSIKTLQNVNAGESISCVVGLVTFPESPAAFRHRFNFGFLENDPNPQNNEVLVEIRTRADPIVLSIPATSIFGNMGLVIGLLLAGWMAMRGRPTF